MVSSSSNASKMVYLLCKLQNLDAVYPDAPALTRALAKLVYTDLLNGKLSNLTTAFKLTNTYKISRSASKQHTATVRSKP